VAARSSDARLFELAPGLVGALAVGIRPVLRRVTEVASRLAASDVVLVHAGKRQASPCLAGVGLMVGHLADVDMLHQGPGRSYTSPWGQSWDQTWPYQTGLGLP
jgi:hypothetical protein